MQDLMLDNVRVHDGKPVIQFEALHPALIVPMQTGVIYTTQAGGVGCAHPWIEGAYVPLENFSVPAVWRIQDLGCFGCASGLTLVDAVGINGELAEVGLPIEVDPNRLHESTEAWVWVNILVTDKDHELKPWEGKSAILVWENCD